MIEAGPANAGMRKSLFAPELQGPHVFRRNGEAAAVDPAVLARRYDVLGLADLFMDFAGQREPGHPIHAALARLSTGARLRLAGGTDAIDLLDNTGCRVGLLSKSAQAAWSGRLRSVEMVRVLALLQRTRDDVADEHFRAGLRSDSWELPVVEVVSSQR